MKLLGNAIENLVGEPIYYLVQITNNNTTNTPSLLTYNTTPLKKVCEFYDIEFNDFKTLTNGSYTFINASHMLQLPTLLHSFESTFTITFYIKKI